MKAIMEFIRTIREKQQTSWQNSISEQAHSCICLDDFEGNMCISFNGVPLIPIEESWSQEDILKKLEKTRETYINYKMKQTSLPKVAML